MANWNAWLWPIRGQFSQIIRVITIPCQRVSRPDTRPPRRAEPSYTDLRYWSCERRDHDRWRMRGLITLTGDQWEVMMSPACLGSWSRGQSRPRHKEQSKGCDGNQPEILKVDICFVVVTTKMSAYLRVYLFMDNGSLPDKVQGINWCCSKQA